MKGSRVSGLAAIALVAAGMAMVAAPAPAAAQKKEPPKCAAISFRPVVPGAPDGQQEAGMYRSRFGKIEIVADVKGGQAANYAMVLNGRRIETGGNPPKASDACLKSKHVKVPFQKQSGACNGNRFRVVIDRSGAKPVALFFGLIGDEWVYCSGTEVPGA